MRTYEYKCQVCGAVFEEKREIDDIDKPTKCKNCGRENTCEVVMQHTPISLKGGGFTRYYIK